MSLVSKIEPIQLKEYKTKQSKYDVVSKLLIRTVILGPSGAGKGILIQNLILDVYNDLFERIYEFSPSIHVDHTNGTIKNYLDNNIKLSDDEPALYYDHYDPEALQDIIDTQRQIIEHQKTKQLKTLISDLNSRRRFCR